MKVSELFEEIKGWKHAGRDLAAHRSAKGKDVRLVRLKKDGTESKMNDATKMFKSPEDAKAHHANIVKLNPKSRIKHNLYVDGKPELLEGTMNVQEPGWYVCDSKERAVHGPMSEMKAKNLADDLSKDGKTFSAEYFSDYQIKRMNEGWKIGESEVNEQGSYEDKKFYLLNRKNVVLAGPFDTKEQAKTAQDKKLEWTEIVTGEHIKKYLLDDVRLDELSPETLKDYRTKRGSQQKHSEADKPHPGDHGNGNVRKGMAASFNRLKKAELAKNPKSGSIQSTHYSGKPGSYTGD